MDVVDDGGSMSGSELSAGLVNDAGQPWPDLLRGFCF